MSDISPSSSTRPCPNCGAAIAADDANGLCGACLMAAVAKSTLRGSGPPRKSWEPPSAEELGRLLPQYRIERLLGRGGMGAVYQGRQVALDRLVAIKILSNDLEEADASFAERFKNEARAMAKLSHPGIVTVHDFGETANGLLYIVMEFVEGTDVARMIAAQGRLHSEHAMAITAHVCDALAYAHERGIIHRDIKPANIMVGYDGVVKVADFGLAKVSASGGETLGLTQSGMAMGTLHFMAPEALMLGSAVDQRADIYAVGVMLYQMLTGKLPHGMFELPSIQVKGLDPRYDGIIARAMREDRELRYQNAREMRHDLDGILTQPVQRVEAEATQSIPAALPTEVRPRRSPAGQPSYRPPPHSAPLPVKKKSSAGIVFLTLGLLAAIGAALFFLGGQRKAPSGVTAAADSGPAPSTASTTALTSATKDQPFVNTLGMKFVPVPGTKVLMCMHETRRQDYRVFADAVPATDATWKSPIVEGKPLAQGEDHPVVQVSWEDAQAFCTWLGKKEGLTYRLPTEHEWNLAVAIGVENPDVTTPDELLEWITDSYPWPNPALPVSRTRIGAKERQSLRDKYGQEHGQAWKDGFKYGNFLGTQDGYEGTSPVMSYLPNHLGIHDLGGNAWEWCAALKTTEISPQPLRGAGYRNYSWLTVSHMSALSERSLRSLPSSDSVRRVPGFRCVVELPEATAGNASAAPPPPSTSPSLPISSSSASATKDAPFTNTLGMKFVPVPITGPARSASPSDAGGGPTDGQRVLFSIWETRVQDYEVFVQETKARVRKPPFVQGPTHPAVGMNWNEAKAFCDWLTERERKAGHLTANEVYRLPSDHEWSCAVGIGEQEDPAQPPAKLGGKSGRIPGIFPWGSIWPPPARTGNFAGQELAAALANGTVNVLSVRAQLPIPNYQDGFEATAPVGSFPASPLGLFDLEGNVLEWCEDKFDDESPNEDGVMRGGCWGSGAEQELYLSCHRRVYPRKSTFHSYNGFRVVLAPVIAPSMSATAPVSPSPSLRVSSSPASAATKDAPFTNTLGMKFVPVPITGPARSASPSDAGGGPTDKQRVLFSIWETRVQDYEAFVNETKREWPKPEFEQGPTHPAVNVSWEDVTVFCTWLTEKERKAGTIGVNEVYRLPSDHEWSCAAGIGEQEDASKSPKEKGAVLLPDAYPWGKAWPPPLGSGNYGGEELQAIVASGKYSNIKKTLAGYRDAFEMTAPVGSFQADAVGLFDLNGNVMEWCEDLYESGGRHRVMRGGTWSEATWAVRGLNLSNRHFHLPGTNTRAEGGFRVVLAAAAAGSASAKSPVSASASLPVSSSSASATKDAPFTNTLGMKFVPVPITGPARSASPSDAGGGQTDKQRVLFSIWETRVQDYEVFVKETNRKAPQPRFQSDFVPGAMHPVSAINWDDATAFCAWLTERERKTGKVAAADVYRLPGDHEWSCAVGLGSREDASLSPSRKNRKLPDMFPWGTEWPPPQGVENLAGEELRPLLAGGLHPYIKDVIPGYRDDFTELAPVGSFKANALGLHDLGGNVAEWCEDGLDASKKVRVLRGATWLDHVRQYTFSSMRPSSHPTDSHLNNYGFRVVLAPVAAIEDPKDEANR
jgi:formylglycine-generating enzyme required for sulfatase activity/serine/threonine protein kinase